MTVSPGVRRVQDHSPDRLAAFHDEPQHRQLLVKERSERFMKEGEDRLVLLAEDQGVVRIGGEPLDPVEKRVFQREDIGVGGGIGPDAVRLALGDEPRQIIHGAEFHGSIRKIGGNARRTELSQKSVAEGCGPADQRRQALRIEIDVRHGGEKGLADKEIRRAVADADSLRRDRGLRHPGQRVEQQILQGGHIRLFSADPRLAASLSPGRLFTLITKHGVPPWFDMGGQRYFSRNTSLSAFFYLLHRISPEWFDLNQEPKF